MRRCRSTPSIYSGRSRRCRWTIAQPSRRRPPRPRPIRPGRCRPGTERSCPGASPSPGSAAQRPCSRPPRANPNQIPPTLSGDPGRTIQEQRALIDQLDAQITGLLAQRAVASHNIQVAREQAGGPRLDPAREQQVIARYRDRLGPAGEQVARAVLDADRGAIASSTPQPGPTG
jgi:chorismate mutase